MKQYRPKIKNMQKLIIYLKKNNGINKKNK